MLKRVLLLTTSAFLLACGASCAGAQQGPTTQPQPQIQQQQSEQERQLQGAQTPRRAVHDDIEDDGGMMGWHYGPGWGRGWGPGMGMMGRGGMMGGPGRMHGGMMMRMLFAMMDSDGDGTVSLQEFQAAHERIFKAMDANKDGRLTVEEIQAFMQGARRSVPQQ
jgi:hypothetical protein